MKRRKAVVSVHYIYVCEDCVKMLRQSNKI